MWYLREKIIHSKSLPESNVLCRYRKFDLYLQFFKFFSKNDALANKNYVAVFPSTKIVVLVIFLSIFRQQDRTLVNLKWYRHYVLVIFHIVHKLKDKTREYQR
jgi:hypothetical protein